MKNKHRITGLSLFALFVILSGCGQKQTELRGQSFGSIVSNVESVASPIPNSSVSSKETPTAGPTEMPGATPAATPIVTPIVTPSPSAAVQSVTASASSNAAPSIVPTPSPRAQIESGNSSTGVVTSKPPEPITALPAKQQQLSNELKWDEFFDSDKQDTPSNKFWDLNGKTVQIKGFMGEVLSFDKHWFLLIPKPGAECPFDNGDETYWNKIMIVYVPDSMKLRYTSGPLQLTGRLDVGIKLDESGYKTMFRLYDASFEKIKE
ncbi:hypothetical protein [Paenibacillus sp. Soil750]|uniref:hypothetical protein n=1 Tax=Paenibacillus sp. Soil750 TaxID=1736398 RepID=UPI0007021266|nr:hypothetical protein [Paenibacillus sp. Soil750]KRE74988.1 hypothetical protein ASL11_03605 [Paenibacillus sp. Soil750]